MSSSIAAPRGIETLFPSPEISRYFNRADTPYTSTAQVLSEVLLTLRYIGQTFNVNGVEWCFKNAVTNNDLVVKSPIITPIQNPSYQIITGTKFITDGAFPSQSVKGLNFGGTRPFSYSYNGTVFNFATQITLPTSLDLTIERRLDVVCLTPAGTVVLLTGVSVPISDTKKQPLSPSIPSDYYAYAYVFWNGTASVVSAAGSNDEETLITTGGNKNNQPIPTRFVRFNNMVTPTILSGLSNPVDGKVIRIYNNTLQNLNLLHNSASSDELNRLSNINAQDLFIVIGGAAEYVYSLSQGRWLLMNIWATDYFASLVGIGKRAVAVTSQGMATAEAIVDLKVWDTAKTSVYTKSAINIAYPLLTKGQQVVCPNIAGGGVTYEKYDDSTNDWLSIITPKLT